MSEIRKQSQIPKSPLRKKKLHSQSSSSSTLTISNNNNTGNSDHSGRLTESHNLIHHARKGNNSNIGQHSKLSPIIATTTTSTTATTTTNTSDNNYQHTSAPSLSASKLQSSSSPHQQQQQQHLSRHVYHSPSSPTHLKKKSQLPRHVDSLKKKKTHSNNNSSNNNPNNNLHSLNPITTQLPSFTNKTVPPILEETIYSLSHQSHPCPLTYTVSEPKPTSQTAALTLSGSIPNSSDKGTSSPCSPTSTTHLATPEWASPDLSCRSYLSQISLNLCEKHLTTHQMPDTSSMSNPSLDGNNNYSGVNNNSNNGTIDVESLNSTNSCNSKNDHNNNISSGGGCGTGTGTTEEKGNTLEHFPTILSNNPNTNCNGDNSNNPNVTTSSTTGGIWTKRSLSMISMPINIKHDDLATESQQQLQQQQKATRKSISSTTSSSSSSSSPYSSFSFGRLGSTFGAKRQRQREPEEASLKEKLAKENGAIDPATEQQEGPLCNSYCSECNDYRMFRTMSSDASGIFMECVECHSVSRRRASTSSTSLINTIYISFPSIGDEVVEEESISSNDEDMIAIQSPRYVQNKALMKKQKKQGESLGSNNGSTNSNNSNDSNKHKSALDSYRFLPRIIA